MPWGDDGTAPGEMVCRSHGGHLRGAELLLAKTNKQTNQTTLSQEKSCHIYTELLHLGHAGEMIPQSPTGLTQGLGSPWGGTQTLRVLLVAAASVLPPSTPAGDRRSLRNHFPRELIAGKVIWLSYLNTDALKTFLNIFIKYDALQHHQQKCWQVSHWNRCFLAPMVPILTQGSGSRGGVGLALVQNQNPK